MQLVVQSETANSADILERQRGQEVTNIGNLICNMMLSEYIALHNASLLGLADIIDALWEDGIAVVSTAISRQEANKSLSGVSAEHSQRAHWVAALKTYRK